MGLRAFHVLFIAMATALALAFAGWCLRGFQADRSAALAIAAAGSVALAAALVGYGVVFYRKLGNMDSSR